MHESSTILFEIIRDCVFQKQHHYQLSFPAIHLHKYEFFAASTLRGKVFHVKVFWQSATKEILLL